MIPYMVMSWEAATGGGFLERPFKVPYVEKMNDFVPFVIPTYLNDDVFLDDPDEGYKPKLVSLIKLLSDLQVLLELFDLFMDFSVPPRTLEVGEVVPDTPTLLPNFTRSHLVIT